MPLTLRQIEDVCLWGKHAAQCRFLAEDMNGKFYCIKQTPQRTEMDAEVSAFRVKMKAKGVDPKTLGLPLGDNCKGYTFFKHKKQGYDVPGS